LPFVDSDLFIWIGQLGRKSFNKDKKNFYNKAEINGRQLVVKEAFMVEERTPTS